MAVVLDWSAVVALATDDPARSGPVMDEMEKGTCYMAPAAVAEVYRWLLNHAGEQLAEHWLRVMMSGGDIRVHAEVDPDFMEAVGRLLAGNVSQSGAFSAALARKKGIPVITAALEFTELRRSGFCAVILI